MFPAAAAAQHTVSAAPAASDAPVRRLRVDDLFNSEQISPYFYSALSGHFSANGDAFAFVKGRPKNSRQDHFIELDIAINGIGNGDIWVQLERGATPIRVTPGATDGSSWYRPTWSPDGERLGMLRLGRDTPTLWIWHKRTERLQRVLAEGIHERFFFWLDDMHVLAQLAPPNGREPMQRANGIPDARIIGPKAWAAVTTGERSTASVLRSGAAAAPDAVLAPGQLVKVNVTNGAVERLADGDSPVWEAAPNQHAIARKLGRPGRLQIVDLDGKVLLSHEQSPVVFAIRWSPDGSEIAYFGVPNWALGDRLSDHRPTLYRYRIGAPRPTVVALKGLNPDATMLEWTAGGDLLIGGAKQTRDSGLDASERRDWWLIRRDVPPRCLTEKLPTSSPRYPVRQSDGQSFAFVVNGEVWRFALDGRPAVNLTADLGARVLEDVWPGTWWNRHYHERWSLTSQPYDHLIVALQQGKRPITYGRIDLRSGVTTPLPQPDTLAQFGYHSAINGDVVFSATNRHGTFVWRTSPDGATDTLMAANGYLRDIAQGAFRTIRYRSSDGDSLNGVVILPIGYEAGKRYPLLTWVYAGTVFTPNVIQHAHRRHTIGGFAWPLNLQLAAARGYAVLLPSMPVTVTDRVADVLLDLTNGVVPAVDQVIAEGIADPERLFVMGQSFGGFSTYGLVTQTQRFTAAVAWAGMTNFVSHYGTFDARYRYGEDVQSQIGNATWAEKIQPHLGNPPWKDFGRYLRNSPIFYVDRVETPLLMIHGDMDFVPLQQAEEFFVALHRQGKQAEFVRYWGEGHTIDSPANYRDMWARVSAWFDEFGDIARDERGRLLWDGNRVRSRKGAPPLTPEDFLRLDRMLTEVERPHQ